MTALKEKLEKVVNDSSRKIHIRGKQAIVPLKFDEEGEIATETTRIYKRLSLNDLRFLSAWKEARWDVSVAVAKCNVSEDKVERLINKLACFREEDARVKALCTIPTPDWIAAKHVENIYEGGTLADSAQKSLAELAKIEGAYKNNLQVNVTQNVFNLPKYDAATEAKLKAIADQEAVLIQEAQIVNG